MYPFIRMFKELYLFRKAPRLPVTGTHVSRHRCWPWDIDFWMELNNGRTLTLYDLGRIPLAQRTGFMAVLRRRKWGLTVAGSCTRYRRRIRPFESFEMRSQAVGVDHRFVYLEQSMWKNNGECASHAMYRTAVTGPKGGIRDYGVEAAAVIIAALPTLLVYVAAGKYFVRGLTAGSLKG